MKKIFSAVRDNPLFAGMDAEGFCHMMSCIEGKVRRYDRGEVVLMTGAPVETVGIVASGCVLVFREDAEGKRNLMSALGPGEMFAEAFACAGVASSPVTVAAQDDAQILHIHYRKIISICSSACPFHSRLIENMLQLVSRKNLALHDKVALLSKRTTRQRLFLYFDQCRQNHDCFTLPFSRTAMAEYLCVDRSALSAELSRMQKEGLIHCAGRTIRLLKPSGGRK